MADFPTPPYGAPIGEEKSLGPSAKPPVRSYLSDPWQRWFNVLQAALASLSKFSITGSGNTTVTGTFPTYVITSTGGGGGGGGGTVTSVSGGTGIDVSGTPVAPTVALSKIPDKSILANFAGSIAAAVPTTLNAIASALSSTINWSRPQNVAAQTLTDSASVTMNGDLSNNFYLLSTSSFTTKTFNAPSGTIPDFAAVNLVHEQPASGGPCVITFAASFKWGKGGGDPQPTGSVGAGFKDTYAWVRQPGGTYHGVMIGQSGPQGAGYLAASMTSLTPGAGSRALTTTAGLAYTIGCRARATSASTGDYFEGLVTSYVSGVLTINAVNFSGSTARTDWNINVSGDPGPAGSSGSSNFAGTSTTSNTVGTGSLTFTTQAGLAYVVGTRTRFASSASPSNFVEGVVTAYSGTSITVLSDKTGGAGTFASWNLTIAGQPGATGGTTIARAVAVGSNSAGITTTSNTFADITGMSCSVAAAVGDKIAVRITCSTFVATANISPSFAFKINTTDLTTMQMQKSYATANFAEPVVCEAFFTAAAGDISGGTLTAQARFKTQTAVTLTVQNASGITPVMELVNWGP